MHAVHVAPASLYTSVSGCQTPRMCERLIDVQRAELAQFLHSNALYILLPTPAHNPLSGLGQCLWAATAIVRLLPERLFVQCSAAHLGVEPRTERLHNCRTPFVDRHLARGVVQDTERSEGNTGTFGIAVDTVLFLVLSCILGTTLLQPRVAAGIREESRKYLGEPLRVSRVEHLWAGDFISCVTPCYRGRGRCRVFIAHRRLGTGSGTLQFFHRGYFAM